MHITQLDNEYAHHSVVLPSHIITLNIQDLLLLSLMTCGKLFTLTYFHVVSEGLLELAEKDHNARTSAKSGQLTIPQPK